MKSLLPSFEIPCVPRNQVLSEGSLKLLAARIRASVVELSYRAGTPHLGSSLSCADILAAAYGGSLDIHAGNMSDPCRDRFILSKGHAATALYSCLAFQGFFDPSLLDTYAEPGSTFGEQPSPYGQPGVEAATGSLGHGLSLGLGMALSGKILKQEFRVLALLSDGECNEGSVWEAALFASAQKLSNVTVIVDFNKWQATGRSEEVMSLSPFVDKWKAFGWESCEMDGHDVMAIHSKLREYRQEKPTAIIAHTVKGKGVSFMEDDNNWHYRIPTHEEVLKAHKELGF